MKTSGPAITIALLLFAAAEAQETKPPEAAPTMTARAELVMVPTLVRQKSGAPMTGLSQSDFTLLENGVERKIGVFEEVKTTSVRQQRQTLPAGEFSNYLVRERAPGRVTIIVMDAINTQFSDRSYAQDQIVKFLGELAGSDEPIALLQLTRNGVRVIHDFTTDPSVLAKALRHLKPTAETPVADSAEDTAVMIESQQLSGMMQDMEQNLQAAQQLLAAQLTLDCMQSIARAYAAIPGRKSVIWASGGFPFSIDDLTRALSGGAAATAPSLFDILPFYEKTWRALNNANIALYPVDVRGLVVLAPGAATSGRISNMQAAARQRNSMHQQTLDTFRGFADMTGGKAYFNTNDLAHAFHDAVEDSGSYYLLGFYLPPDDRKPGWRKLQVRVKEKHAEVRARSGFYVMPEEKDKSRSRQSDVELAFVSPLDFTSVPVLARWTGTTPNGSKQRVAFEIFLPSNSVRVDESDRNHMNIDFDAAAREPTGKIAATNGRTLEAHLKPESLQQIRSSGITYKGALDLPPGQYTVRFVVRDNLNGNVGSVAAPLTVSAQ